MRNLLIVCMLLVVGMLAVNTASAADIPQATLQAMGMQGMQSVSDARGDMIRGKGFDFIALNLATAKWGCATAGAGSLILSDCCPKVYKASAGAEAGRCGASSYSNVCFIAGKSKPCGR